MPRDRARLCEGTCSKADRGYRCWAGGTVLFYRCGLAGPLTSPYSMPQARSVDNSIWPNRSQAKKSSETLRYYKRQLELTGVKTKLETAVSESTFKRDDFDEVVIATGVHLATSHLMGQNTLKSSAISTCSEISQSAIESLLEQAALVSTSVSSWLMSMMTLILRRAPMSVLTCPIGELIQTMKPEAASPT